MTDDIKETLVILEQAMTMEQDGRDFYLKAARTTQDKKGQKMFGTLAEDELKHYGLITRQLNSLKSDRTWASSVGVKPAGIDLSRSLFIKDRETLGKGVTVKSSDWDALLFGLDIESQSYGLYRRAAAEIKDPAGKRMFEFLAGQEQTHFDTLMMRYDALFGPVSWQD